jgi:hypothetical protein
VNRYDYKHYINTLSPKIISGNCHSDPRGSLFYNNDFDATAIKRVYVIENHNTDFVRGWQGHKIEQRWFAAMQGSFEIRLMEIDDWENPSKDLVPFVFVINTEKLDVIHVPGGYVNSIQSLEEGSKLLVMSDYLMGEVNDEYRYKVDYFG